ncbi:hypothetical protein [Streptomyces sp. NPDC048603]|uniref:hypothetical protein n=1 Tax=Streptomyces sp. NPDC048603 TaxID=3365577 RepID=UPI00372190C3
MISEPELDGQWDDARPPEPAGGAVAAAPARRRARPWVWAAGGALAASALWAGGLYALGQRPDAPPAMAYELPENLCKVLEIRALTRIAGDMHGNGPEHREAPDPVLDQAICLLSDRDRSEGLGYFVTAQVQLHKKTDPAAEFEVESLMYDGSPERSQVPGLGERALMLVADAGDGAELKVLDGGAVFRLSVSATNFGEGLPDGSLERMDTTAVQAALIEDMREFLKSLRKK